MDYERAPFGLDRDPPRGGPKPDVKWAIIGGIVLIVLFFGSTIANLWAEWMWYSQDAQVPEVFTKALTTRAALWSIGLVAAFLIVFFNVRKATGAVEVFDFAPSNPQQEAVLKVLDGIKRFGRLAGTAVAALVSLGIANGLASSYEAWWMFRAGGEFGIPDPALGNDVGFYVFQLPFLQVVAGSAVTIMFATLLLTAGVYVGVTWIAQAVRLNMRVPAMQPHLTVLGGLTMVAIGVRLMLWRYEILLAPNEQFTGPGFAQTQALGLYGIVAWLAVIAGVVSIATFKVGKPYRILAFSAGGTFAFGLITLGLYPGFVQRFQVEPNKIEVESPFVERAIGMTRWAYGLDTFEIRDFDVADRPTPDQVVSSQATLDNMRLWDPDVLRTALDNVQTLRRFYDFADVDIGRYDIDGEQRMVMLAPRDVMTEGIAQSSRNFVNDWLVYTHGYGAVMTPVNDSTASGRPVFFLQDMPPRPGPEATSLGEGVLDSIPELEQPRIYFSDFPANSRGADEPVVLGTNQPEFDYPAGDVDQTYSWTGERGIPIGGLLTRALFAWRFGETNLLISRQLTDDSKLLFRRDVVERAAAVYPMLRFDRDPYIALADGRITWILDAYTTSRRVPYSRAQMGPLGEVNYLRNSVKITIDAYSGDMNAYAFEPDEPILKMLRQIFPDLIKDREEMPDSLEQHIRYAEDGFAYQAITLTEYHVTEPERFLRNDAAWEWPTETGRTQTSQRILPYFVNMRLPGETRDSFMLILPFTPREKPNMIGWLAAHCDPEEYGKVLLYRFDEQTQTQGPSQIEAVFDSNEEVARINRDFNNDQSQIVPGNLLVIPIGESVLYVKPLFLQTRTSGVAPIPELRKVILGLQNEVVVADTFSEALARLFGESANVTAPIVAPTDAASPAPQTGGQTFQTELQQAAEALRLMDQAEAALRDGDLGRYGELNDQARDILNRLINPPAPEPATESPDAEPVTE